MLYVAAAFWLMVVVLLAWGVHYLWSSLVTARTVNGVLLPGTLAAKLGHTVGLLITGGTIASPAPTRGDDKGGPAPDAHPQSKIPIIGPVVVALLPMAALGGALYLVIARLGAPVLEKLPSGQVSPQLPTTLAAFWEQLRALISLCESTLAAVQTTDSVHWRTVIFAYLMVCFTVWMAPLPGNARGHIGAVAVLGVLAWLIGTVSAGVPDFILRLWPLLSLTVGWLLLLMMISLAVRGAVSSIQMMMRLA
jgi:hypothetical protein